MALAVKFIGGHAAIEHINLRKQGNDDASVLAIDVKVSGETPAQILNDLLGAAADEDVAGMFWSTAVGSDPASLKSYNIKDVEVGGVWPNRIVHFGAHKVVADVKKISFAPAPGHRLDLTVSISIESPDKALLEYLADKIKENVMCRIESQPELALGNVIPFGERDA